MKVAIWNTYVKRKDVEKEMQFDIVVPKTMNNMQTIIEFGLEYIKSKPFDTWGLSSTECSDCNVSKNSAKNVLKSIKKNGYAINELANCH